MIRIGGRGRIIGCRRVIGRSVGSRSVGRRVDCARPIRARGGSPVDIAVSCALPVGARGGSTIDVAVGCALPIGARGGSSIGVGVACALPVAARGASTIGIRVRGGALIMRGTPAVCVRVPIAKARFARQDRNRDGCQTNNDLLHDFSSSASWRLSGFTPRGSSGPRRL